MTADEGTFSAGIPQAHRLETFWRDEC